MLSAVKDVLTKDVDVKEFLGIEIEKSKLKDLLDTEIKLKDFLAQEVDLDSILSKSGLTEKSRRKKTAEADHNAVASTEIINEKLPVSIKRDLPAFDYSLIDTLHTEHKEIRFIFNQIMSFTVEKEYQKVAGQLEHFNKKIRDHYQKADVELYSYLKTYVQIKYPKREKAFTQLSLEMKNLSIEIFYVLTQSPNIPLSDKTYCGFMKEFMSMGKLLNERILREESVLFKMYQQTNVVKSIS